MQTHRQVADVVAERIEGLITDSVFKPGQALPSERRLTEKLGVSRSALREGLKLLRARGLIETSQGKGSFVANLMSHTMQTPMLHLLGSQPRTLYDLLEVRELLESEAARLAAERGTPADFVLIGRRYKELRAAHDTETSRSEHARLDHAFHLSICEASHNPMLVHTLSALNDVMLSSVMTSVDHLYHRKPLKLQIDRQHARLFNAVTGKLPEQARKAAQHHVRSIRSNLHDIEQEEQREIRATLRLEVGEGG
ncbi:transcriptional regulator GlcC [Allopusillimonas ginsengisoli]|uniref:transcriptional regulator GlcC n=1 Tax=Allopusillimonas ginsengisoli TaxID=453575 RepID=UPI0010C2296D|nr:transcriptional regulator GlcC [Allopusillimonas ginsengisoli]